MAYLINSSFNAAPSSLFSLSACFRGKASDASFKVNRGTGGEFSQVGTISDYATMPSY